MATSGNIQFIQTRNEIIKAALLKCRVTAEGEDLTAEMLTTGARELNAIVKFWQTQGYHLWKEEEAVLFTEPGKAMYLLGPEGDLASAEIWENIIKYQAYAGNDQFYLVWRKLPQVGDFIGVTLNGGNIFFATVTAVEDDLVTIDRSLPECASPCTRVYFFSSKIERPLKILQARRCSPAGIEIEMNNMEREQYFKLPDKESRGTPVNYYYSPQLGSGCIYLWPVPADASFRIKFTYEQSFDVFDVSKNTPDMPAEWIEPLTWELAYRMSANFGLPLEEREWLKAQAKETLEAAKTFDAEVGSFYIQPDMIGRRGAN